MQKATTKEPDLEQLEVAITALKNAMPAEFPEVLEEEKPAEEVCEENKENEENSDLQ